MIIYIYIIILSSFLFCSNDYDNIYNIISSPRNNAIGGLHISTNDISGIFDSPLDLNSKDNNLFISLNNFNNFLTTYHIAYCLYADNNMNLSLGLVRREIYDNYNTHLAWQNDGYPDLEEINYDRISSFSDKQTGLLLAYNNILTKNFIIGINFKPEFHKIGNISAIGYRMDIRYLIKLSRSTLSFGIDNLFATKKWETNLIEKSNLNVYISSSILISKKITLFYEYGIEQDFRFGTEIKLMDKIFISWGFNGLQKSNFNFGVGFDLKNMNLEYTYRDNAEYILGSNHVIGFIIKLNNFY